MRIEGSTFVTLFLGVGLVGLYAATVVGFFMMVGALRRVAANTDDMADMLQNIANELAHQRRDRDRPTG